jgi:hypothetical protein
MLVFDGFKTREHDLYQNDLLEVTLAMLKLGGTEGSMEKIAKLRAS